MTLREELEQLAREYERDRAVFTDPAKATRALALGAAEIALERVMVDASVYAWFARQDARDAESVNKRIFQEGEARAYERVKAELRAIAFSLRGAR